MDKRAVILLATFAMAVGAGGCTVKKTEDGEAPKVEGGKLPKYEVEPAKVEVKTDTHTVVTPTVKVTRDTTHH